MSGDPVLDYTVAMGATTEIRWTDSTFNPWWGCARVSEACQHCYAESWAKRFGVEWGKKAERRTFGDKHWDEPLRWNRQAEAAGVRRLVFCASMADVFEDHHELPPERERLWDLIAATPALTWQLLTKRPENILGMVPKSWIDRWPANVWAGTTVENQRWADERIPHLLEVPAPVRFLSCEPLFGPLKLGLRVDHRNHERDHITTDAYFQCLDCSTEDEIVDWTYPDGLRDVDWVIAGGESGSKAQPSDPDWFRSIRDQCVRADVPFLFNQWGEFNGEGNRVGKKAAGHVLDGRTHDAIPTP